MNNAIATVQAHTNNNKLLNQRRPQSTTFSSCSSKSSDRSPVRPATALRMDFFITRGSSPTQWSRTYRNWPCLCKFLLRESNMNVCEPWFTEVNTNVQHIQTESFECVIMLLYSLTMEYWCHQTGMMVCVHYFMLVPYPTLVSIFGCSAQARADNRAFETEQEDVKLKSPYNNVF